MLDQVQEEEKDHAIGKLLAGEVPLLDRGDADGQERHEHRAADKRDTGEDPQDER